MSDVAVSVIMAAHNVGRFVDIAIESIVAQTLCDWELIVVDDASTDATWEILQRWCDPRIAKLKNDVNVGPAATRNRALKSARGDYIAVLDADDIAAPDRLEKQVRYLEQHQEVTVVGGAAIVVDASGTPYDRIVPPAGHWKMVWLLIAGSTLVHSSVMMRRKAMMDVGGYNEAMPCAQDYDLWCRIVLQGGRLANMLDDLVQYRRSAGQISTARKAEQNAFARLASVAYIRNLLDTNVSDGAVEALRKVFTPWHGGLRVREMLEGMRCTRRICTRFAGATAMAERDAVAVALRECLLGGAASCRKRAPMRCMGLVLCAMRAGAWRQGGAWRLLGSAAKNGLLNSFSLARAHMERRR